MKFQDLVDKLGPYNTYDDEGTRILVWSFNDRDLWIYFKFQLWQKYIEIFVRNKNRTEIAEMKNLEDDLPEEIVWVLEDLV